MRRCKKVAFRTTHQFKLENPLLLFGEALARTRKLSLGFGLGFAAKPPNFSGSANIDTAQESSLEVHIVHVLAQDIKKWVDVLDT